MIHDTKRLILRPWEDTDAPSLFKYAQDERVGPIAGWPAHTSVENSLEIIHSVLSENETYAVVLKETNEPIGSIGLMFKGGGSAPIDDAEAEIGYWIGVPYWGKGLIPEAVNCLIDYCFKKLQCKGIWCGYYDGNDKSKRVQEKCGFIYHHTLKDVISPMNDVRTEHFTYMTKEQWNNKQNSNHDFN